MLSKQHVTLFIALHVTQTLAVKIFQDPMFDISLTLVTFHVPYSGVCPSISVH